MGLKFNMTNTVFNIKKSGLEHFILNHLVNMFKTLILLLLQRLFLLHDKKHKVVGKQRRP